MLALAASVFLINGCSSNGEERPEYMDATTTSQLEIPPKLTSPNTQGALRLPEPSEKALAAASDKEDVGLATTFEGIELKQDGQLYWLKLDYPVEQVWASLREFLAAEGIDVKRADRALGFVDTVWMNEYPISYGTEDSGKSWFSGFSPDYKDKFRLRVEAINEQQTRLFVSHRGLQIMLANEGTKWVQREPEAILERELMYRYALYAGATRAQATELLVDYQSYQPRVTESADNPARFQVQGSADIVWLRLRAAMDRLGVDIVETDSENRSLLLSVGTISPAQAVKQESSGWFSGLFGGDVKVEEQYDFEDTRPQEELQEKMQSDTSERLQMRVQQQAGQYVSTIIVSYAGSSDALSGDALDFRNALINQLR
jgi:uncharacterized lipoprotein